MMKKLFVSAAILLSFAVFALTVFYSYFNTTASIDYPYEGDEPDLPPSLQGKINKEEFMLSRAEGIGLKRGIDKNKPLPNPKIRQTAIAKMEQQQEALANKPESDEKSALMAAWTPIGPAPIPNGQTVGTSTPVSGRVTAIAVHPTNPNIVYVGTAQGGLYRTLDGGTNWTPMLDNTMSLSIGTVAIAPSQPETVYVGTGEGNFSADSFFGVGIYRINNASSTAPVITGPLNKTSSNADIFTGCGISKIIVHPTDPATIFASTTRGRGGIGGFSTQGAATPSPGIYRSRNATSASPTFGYIGPLSVLSPTFPDVRDIAIDPFNPARMVAVLAAVGNGGGLYSAIDALDLGPQFSQDLSFNAPSPGSISPATGELAVVSGATGPIFYAATGVGSGTIYRSQGGVTWTPQVNNSFCGGQCFYDIAIAVDPTNPNRVYLGGDPSLPFAISSNGGTSFTSSSSGLHVDSHVITVAPSLPSTIYFGSDGGIYKSIDSGASWINLNNSQFSATQFQSIAVHPTDPNFTIGGTQDNGTNFFQPQGTWTRSDAGDGGYTLIDRNATDTTNVRMYHTYFNNGSQQGYATVSTTAQARDGGWTQRGCRAAGATANGITCGGAVNFYAPLAQGPGNPNTIYFATDRLYRSTDAGLNHQLASQAPITAGVPISAVGISPQNDNVRIVGQNNGGIWGTITGTPPPPAQPTLTNLDPTGTVPDRYIARAVIDPNNQNTAYVTLSAFGVVNVWKTTNLNNGVPNWTAAAGSGTTALPQVPVNAFLVDRANSATLYAGTDIGMFVSTDGGATWAPFGTGLPRVAVFDMAITADSKLRIATHGRGMFEMALNASPRISINDVSLNEGNTGTTAFTFTVTLSPASPQTVTVNYATANGTATAGSDYVSNSGTVTFNPGETSKPVTVQVNGDTTTEPNETFTVNLSNAVNAPVSDNQGVGTILNDDSAISINDVSLNEGNTGTTAFTFTVNVTPPSQQAVTVNYATTNGTAVAPTDYTAIPQTLLVFGAGEASKQITVSVNGDTTVEPNETFFVNLSNPSNSVISDNQGVGTILNDDSGGCSYTINPTSQSFPVSGGGGAVQVTTQSGCTWAAVSNNSFADSLSSMRNQNGQSGDNDFIDSLTTDINELFSSNSPTTVFTNPAPITIFDFDTASPYPSNITVSGMTGTVTDLNVRINNLSHTFPDDIAMLLVSPDGTKKFILQSDSGGGTDAVNLTYTFDDQAANNIPDDGPMPPNNGSVRPSSVGDDDGMPPPAPALPYSQPASAGTATLNGTFGGINPNGAWSLYVIDYFDGDAGLINGGWSLDITTQGGGAANFITIAAGQTGNGNGTVTYSVGQNTTGQARTGTMTIAGQTFTVNQSNTPTNPQTRRAPADFDGDNKTDLSIFRPAPGEWWYLRSSDGGNRTFQFGNSSNKLVPADYTGDGKTDVAFFRPQTSEWFILRSEDNSFFSFPFGTTGDVPVPADFDGDGKADVAVYRPSNQTWFIFRSTGGVTIETFGIAGDVPVTADYDGDGKSDLAIYRVALGQWWQSRSSQGVIVYQFGLPTDKPVQGDYTGDGKTDVAFFRPSTNEWFVLRSENNSFYSFPFGASGDVPSPGDYDGDGRTDAAVFRPSNQTWFAQRSTAGTLIQGFGIAGDISLPNAFVP